VIYAAAEPSLGLSMQVATVRRGAHASGGPHTSSRGSEAGWPPGVYMANGRRRNEAGTRVTDHTRRRPADDDNTSGHPRRRDV